MLRVRLCVTLTLAASVVGVDVEKTAESAVSKLESMGADSVQKRAVVGGAAGFVGGLLIKKTQDMALMCGVLGGAAVAGACYAARMRARTCDTAAAARLLAVVALLGSVDVSPLELHTAGLDRPEAAGGRLRGRYREGSVVVRQSLRRVGAAAG
jgi:hypothetical protein